MTLKKRVVLELKKQKRSSTWLAEQIGKSVDGLRLSLQNESIKYVDIVKLCRVLGISAEVLFEEEGIGVFRHAPEKSGQVPDDKGVQGDDLDMRSAEREMIRLLNDRLRDKERIISLLSK